MNETLTIKELKQYVKDLPEVDEYGDDYEVWIDNGNLTSSPCTAIHGLNLGDIILIKELHNE